MLRTTGQLLLLLVLGLTSSLFTNAQFIPDLATVSLNATPSAPSPGDTVLIEAFAPIFNKDTATFSWTVNGKSRPDLSGVGRDSVEISTGDVGSILNVSMTISDAAGITDSASLSISVSDLALVWSAKTYTPKWYKGKALPVQGSVVRVVAVPNITLNGRRLNPGNLVYAWSIDDAKNVLTGAGEDSLEVSLSGFSKTTHDIRLTVRDTDGQAAKEAQIFIRPREPRVVLYQILPLGGIRSRIAPEIISVETLAALDFATEPFFFPISSKDELAYEWTVGGASIITGNTTSYIATVDPNIYTAGLLPISVRVSGSGPTSPTLIKTISLRIP